MSAITEQTVSEHIDLQPAALIQQALLRLEGQLTDTGALAVSTGPRTERQPLDRFIVNEPSTNDSIDWGPVNQPVSSRQFDDLWSRVSGYLADRDTFSTDLHLGQDPEHYLPICLRTETAWHNLAGQILFIRPQTYNPKGKETWSIIHAAHFNCEPARDGTHSEAAIMINFARRKIILAGTGYTGELKKAMFTAQNFLLPEKEVLPLHCAANISAQGEVCLFFGLSGTGKSTLSGDPDRALISDDELGWDEGWVFNLEDGCYPRCINLDATTEPQTWQAIRFGALLENVVIDPVTRRPDYADSQLATNARACYPLTHIANRFTTRAPEPASIIFLTCDLSGILPPVAKLSRDAAVYHFLSGYSSQWAAPSRNRSQNSSQNSRTDGSTPASNTTDGDADNTDMAMGTTIEALFSACYSAPFMPRPAALYADLFARRLDDHETQVYLVNTGWYGGKANEGGERYSLAMTRRLITAIQTGELLQTPMSHLEPMNLSIPRQLPGFDPRLLDPRSAWPSAAAYTEAANHLAGLFVDNFKQFDVATAVVDAGPHQTSSFTG